MIKFFKRIVKTIQEKNEQEKLRIEQVLSDCITELRAENNQIKQDLERNKKRVLSLLSIINSYQEKETTEQV